jgi:hypothetical protein
VVKKNGFSAVVGELIKKVERLDVGIHRYIDALLESLVPGLYDRSCEIFEQCMRAFKVAPQFIFQRIHECTRVRQAEEHLEFSQECRFCRVPESFRSDTCLWLGGILAATGLEAPAFRRIRGRWLPFSVCHIRSPSSPKRYHMARVSGQHADFLWRINL